MLKIMARVVEDMTQGCFYCCCLIVIFSLLASFLFLFLFFFQPDILQGTYKSHMELSFNFFVTRANSQL